MGAWKQLEGFMKVFPWVLGVGAVAAALAIVIWLLSSGGG